MDEVVDVTSVTLPNGKNAVLERCLEQVTWDLDLPSGFDDPWASWSVTV